MAHLRERNHGERFAKLMDSLLADWRAPYAVGVTGLGLAR
jgi:predicted metal-dependent hydrolase